MSRDSYTTRSDQHSPWVDDDAWQWWLGSEAWGSMPSSGAGWGNDSGPSSEARGVGPQPTSWALCLWTPGPQEHAWTGQDDGWTAHDHTWGYQHAWTGQHDGEEDGQEDFADQQKPKKKKKKSANPGAHKRWLEAEMQPDDYT